MAGALALGGSLGADQAGGSDRTGGESARTALVIDASQGRDGRELVDPRLRDLDADVRLPRDSEEARTNVRYFDALGYRVYVAGTRSAAAAEQTGVQATEVDGLDGALTAVR